MFPGQLGYARRAWRQGYAGPGLPGVRGVRWVALLLMAVLMAIAISIFAAIAHSHLFNNPAGSFNSPSGTCVGGPAAGSAGQSVGNGNYKFPCSGGGSVVVHVGN